MPLGYLCLVLHAHLPFVRHPEYDDFLEEDWLYEAITETYIPLLEVFDGLERDGVDWRLTMSVTPTLAAMLSDPLLQYRYVRHLDNLIALAGKEIERTRWQPEFHHLAQMYHHRFTRARDVFVNQYGNNLLNGFRRFFETGKLELITCGATHGFLPLMDVNRNAVRAQIEVGCREFERHFGRGRRASGCRSAATSPGVDELLRDCRHPLLLRRHARRPVRRAAAQYGVYAPILCPKSGVAVLARDTESSKQVWSAIEGYPGDYNYREFYRDVGFDLDYDYLKPHLHQTGIRSHLGIKYYKITGRDRPQGAVQPAGRPGQGRRARRQLHVQPREAGRMAGRRHGRPAAADRRPLRRRAVRPLVVRGARLDQLPAAQDALRPADGQDDHRARVSRPASRRSRWRSRRCRAGATRATARSGWKAPTTGSTATCTRAPTAWWSWPGSNPDRDAAAPPGPQPGRPRAAAGPVQRLGLHHEDRHDGRLRPRADPRPRAQLQPPVRAAQAQRHRRAVAEPRSSGGTTCSRTSIIGCMRDRCGVAFSRRPLGGARETRRPEGGG